MHTKAWRKEVDDNQRFQFGSNWKKYLRNISESRIQKAIESLQKNLGANTLEGKSFLDIGCGSGLFSLAARKLGAHVISLDFDPQSVECTAHLRDRFFPNDEGWRVQQGSALSPEDLRAIGKCDIVYSWGVLHHTGSMWQALENIVPCSSDNGKLYIALYNDQGTRSKIWWWIKKIYVSLPAPLQTLYAVFVSSFITIRSFLISCVGGNVRLFFRHIFSYESMSGRGMSWWRDQVDWIGGFPFEVSKPEQIFEFFRANGYALEKLKTCSGGLGCNEYVFRRLKQQAEGSNECELANEYISQETIAA